jgi:putative addiction module killer protein
LRKIRTLTTRGGKNPFEDWLSKLSVKNQANIDSYLKRLARGGSKKNIKSLDHGLFELKINTGPGFRIYFAQIGRLLIFLIIGGDKSSQKRDITKAKKYWSEYRVQNRML